MKWPGRSQGMSFDRQRWQEAVAATLLLLTTACQPLEPSGRRPEPTPPQDMEAQPSPAEEEGGDTLTVQIQFLNSGIGRLFDETVRPALKASCLAGGCHTSSEVINLHEFPFDASGSYTMDRITAELGQDYDEHEAQKIIVEELITAMDSGYMPPPPNDPMPTEAIESFETWLGEDLPISNFEGLLLLEGWEKNAKRCQFEFAISPQAPEVSLDLSACAAAEILRYRLTMAVNQEEGDGQQPLVGEWVMSERESLDKKIVVDLKNLHQ